MLNQKRREADKPVKKYSVIIHYMSGGFLGWMAKVYFPDKNALEIFGEAWGYVVGSIQALGGLAAISSFLIACFTVYKYLTDRSKK